jgi:hypothetical protein
MFITQRIDPGIHTGSVQMFGSGVVRRRASCISFDLTTTSWASLTKNLAGLLSDITDTLA